MNLEVCLIPYTKLNSKSTVDLNAKGKTINKSFKKKTLENTLMTWGRQRFLKQDTKSTNRKWEKNLHEITLNLRPSSHQKTLLRVKRQATQ